VGVLAVSEWPGDVVLVKLEVDASKTQPIINSNIEDGTDSLTKWFTYNTFNFRGIGEILVISNSVLL